MGVVADQPVIHHLYSAGRELNPPFSTYVVAAGTRTVVIDPGPDWHVRDHLERLRQWITPECRLVVIIQSPGPEACSGLHHLTPLATGGTVVLHWKAAALAGAALEPWKTQELTTQSAGIALSDNSRLVFGLTSPRGGPGALMSFERSTGTLFSGPFFGSLGPGQETGVPALRHESVRAYRDVFTPHIDVDLVESLFGGPLAINQIAPSHGRIAVGGASLIRTLFHDEGGRNPAASALYRIYLRAAALIGPSAASGIYQAAGVPVPEVEAGYSAFPETLRASLGEPHWTRLLASFAQWLSGSARTALYPVVVRVATRAGLPLPRDLERFARAAAIRPGAPADTGGPAPTAADGADARPGGGDAKPGGAGDLADPLTGLMNETVCRQRLAGQFGSGDDQSGRGAVVFLGVDSIPRINATYGRSAGDEALYTVGYLLRNFQSARSRRGTHRLYRLSGPMFAYILSSGAAAEGAEIAEQLRRSVSESAMFLEQLTVSAGVAGLEEALSGSDPRAEPVDLVQATFRIGLGRLQVARQSGANTVCASDPEGVAGRGAGSTVLIADPDAPYLEMLTRQLEERGFTVLLARDGSEAIRIVEQIVPDAIVAEVMLPKRNGFTLREELRHDARLSQIPFVLVSHRKTDEVVLKASLLGIVHFLAKPFSLVELTGLLHNLTGGNQP